MYTTVNLSPSIMMNAFDGWDLNLNSEHFSNLNQLLLEGPTFHPPINTLETTVNHANAALLEDTAWQEINTFPLKLPVR
jgi:hypothetical protein